MSCPLGTSLNSVSMLENQGLIPKLFGDIGTMGELFGLI